MLLGDDGQTEEVPFKAKAKALGKTLYQTRHDRLNDYLYAKLQPPHSNLFSYISNKQKS